MHFSTQKLSKLYSAQIFCMTIALLLSRQGERVGFLGNASSGQSEQALHALGQCLIEAGDVDLHHISPELVPKGANLILCGDFLSPLEDVEATLLPLLARCGSCVMIQILDPAEITLNFDGRIKFRDSDGDRGIEIDHVASVREAYKARIQEHLDGLAQWCLRHNVTYIRHITDEDISAKIVELNMIGRAA